MLRLFLADISGIDPDKAAELLPPQRLEKMRRLRTTESKQQCAAAYLLLCRAANALGISPEYTVGRNGKPDFTDGRYHFSLSHSGKYALCAVSDVSVGADIELPRADYAKIAQRFFTKDEALLCTTPDSFCRIWTQKESYIKALGLRLSALGSFSVTAPPEGVCFSHFAHDGYHISVCAVGNEQPPCVELCDLKKH